MFRGLSVNPISVQVIMYIKLAVSWCATFPFPSRNCLWLPLRISSGGGRQFNKWHDEFLLFQASHQGRDPDNSLPQLKGWCRHQQSKYWKGPWSKTAGRSWRNQALTWMFINLMRQQNSQVNLTISGTHTTNNCNSFIWNTSITSWQASRSNPSCLGGRKDRGNGTATSSYPMRGYNS